MYKRLRFCPSKGRSSSLFMATPVSSVVVFLLVLLVVMDLATMALSNAVKPAIPGSLQASVVIENRITVPGPVPVEVVR
jgi:hypothetical protein